MRSKVHLENSGHPAIMLVMCNLSRNRYRLQNGKKSGQPNPEKAPFEHLVAMPMLKQIISAVVLLGLCCGIFPGEQRQAGQDYY